MPGRNVTRRLFVGVVGGGVLAAPVVASAFAEPSSAPSENGTEPATRENVAKLLYPLVPGSRLARWTILQIEPIANGGVRIKVRAEDQHTFDLELLARDTSSLAQRPPAETERHAVFVANGGDGWTATHEEQGLAAMTLAQIVARNEGAVRLSGFLTHAERISNHGGALLASKTGEAAL